MAGRTNAKLYVELPAEYSEEGDGAVELITDDGDVKVCDNGEVMARETRSGTWRVIGSIPYEYIPTFMEYAEWT